MTTPVTEIWDDDDEALLAWLDKASERERVRGLRDFLNGEDFGVFPIPDPSRPSRRALEAFVLRADRQGHPEARATLSETVTALVNAIVFAEMHLAFAREAILLVGGLRAYGAYPRLLVLAKNETLKEVRIDGVDLHAYVLGVLFGLTNEFDVLTICRRDIMDSRYALHCFRKLWELDFSNAIPYLPAILDVGKRDRLGAKTALARFLKSVGADGAHAYMPQIMHSLGSRHLGDFIALAAEVGLYLLVHRTHDDPRISMIWLVEGIDRVRGGMDVPLDLHDTRFSDRSFVNASFAVQRGFMKVSSAVTDAVTEPVPVA